MILIANPRASNRSNCADRQEFVLFHYFGIYAWRIISKCLVTHWLDWWERFVALSPNRNPADHGGAQPSSGKSTTLNSLTDATSKVGMRSIQTPNIVTRTNLCLIYRQLPVCLSYIARLEQPVLSNRPCANILQSEVSRPLILSEPLDTFRLSAPVNDMACQTDANRIMVVVTKDDDPFRSNC